MGAKNIIQRLVACLFVLILAGCVSPAVLRQQETQASFLAAKAYCDQLLEDAALKPLSSKTDITVGNYTFQMLADETRITDLEKPAVALLGDKGLLCQARYIAGMRQFLHPLLVANRQAYNTSVNAVRVDLYNGRVTWGQYHQTRAKLFADVQKSHSEITAALDRQDQQAAIAKQQAAAAEYANYLQLQRNLILQQPAIAPSSTINCTSQTLLGGITTTNCR